MNLTYANWSLLSRKGKEYMDRLKAGESFIIYHAGVPVAVMRPLVPGETVRLTLEEE